jgi:cobalt-zinc-cadmium efflux system protein
MSILLSVLTAMSIWPVIKESAHILLEGTPKGVRPSVVRKVLKSVPGVLTVDSLVITQLSRLESN